VAVSPVTGEIYATLASGGAPYGVAVINPNGTIATTLQSGFSQPFGVAVSPVTGQIYVSNFTGGSVSVLNPVTSSQVAITGFTSPVGVAVGPTGNIYVTNDIAAGTVSVINPAGVVIATIAVGSDPRAVAAP
jgi:hypothetical protein